ncbi:MAG TPA: TrmH family RNA methyltransferase [Candidatus Saccharimonadales bacterium]|nr:TrmH family RNA methyltransferase [Candidatus Saccharimonadales bacterium]
MKLAAKQLRVSEPTPKEIAKIEKNSVYIILDNVLDTYNIGAVFRLADAVSATKVYLCAGSETPPNHRIKKASINTTEWVAWEYKETALEAVESLRREVPEIQIVAVELDDRSVPYDKVEYTFPVAIVVGHETDGVSEEVLKVVDKVVELPMWGVNISLNVMVSLGILLYEVMKHYAARD